MDGANHYWRGKQVALTGASGFVGSHLARRLVAAGARVSAAVRRSARRHLVPDGVKIVEADLNNREALSKAFGGAQVVFHTAAAVGFHEDWDQFHRVNVVGTQMVVAAARTAGVQRLVHTSSIVAVGAARISTPLDESSTWNLGQLRTPYAATKRESELIAMAANGGGLQVVVVNPGCVVGPDDWSASEFGTFCRRFWCGHIPFCFGGGNNFVDVRDVVTGMLAAGEYGHAGERYLLVGENRTYRAFCSDLARAARSRVFCLRLPNVIARLGAATARFLPRGRRRRPYLTPSLARLLGWYFFFDASKARRELNFHPRPLAETLTDTHDFWMGRAAA
jgi:dihydroflavonol-4-reductase